MLFSGKAPHQITEKELDLVKNKVINLENLK
jgi:hypothetical protein